MVAWYCVDALEDEYVREDRSPYVFFLLFRCRVLAAMRRRVGTTNTVSEFCVRKSFERDRDMLYTSDKRTRYDNARRLSAFSAFTWIDPVEFLVDVHRVTFVVRWFWFLYVVILLSLSRLCTTRSHSLNHHSIPHRSSSPSYSTFHSPCGQFLFLSLPPRRCLLFESLCRMVNVSIQNALGVFCVGRCGPSSASGRHFCLFVCLVVRYGIYISVCLRMCVFMLVMVL